MKRVFHLVFVLIMVGGCQHTTPGKIASVQPTSTHPRAGNVYLIRGWIGVFSAGIDTLSDKLADAGVRAVVYQDDQWRDLAKQIAKEYQGKEANAEPLVLIGHSYGADDIVRVSRQLADANVKVDLLITLDPVTRLEVPPNVTRCVNLYQTNGIFAFVPIFRGVPLKSGAKVPDQVVNADPRSDRKDLLEPSLNHFNIEKNRKVQAEVIRVVSEFCPPRKQWAVMRGARELPNDGGVSDGSAMPAAASVRPVDTRTSLSNGTSRSEGQPDASRGN